MGQHHLVHLSQYHQLPVDDLKKHTRQQVSNNYSTTSYFDDQTGTLVIQHTEVTLL